MSGKDFFKTVFSNWHIKLLSLIIAVFIVVVYRIQSLDERYLTVPLKVKYSSKVIPSSAVAEVVKLTIKGKTEDIFLISDRDIVAVANFSDIYENGKYSVPIKLEKSGSAKILSDIEIVVSPSSMSVTLEEKLRKTLKIVPDTVGMVATGYGINSETMTPQYVMVEGPKSYLNNISTISTETINISDIKEDSSFETRVKIENNSLKIIGSPISRYSINIGEVIKTQIINNLDLSLIGAEKANLTLKYNYDISKSFIKIRAKELELLKKRKDIFSFYIDCSFINDVGTYTLKVQTYSIDGFEILNFEPKTIVVEAVKKEE